jgi:hypothetical protein
MRTGPDPATPRGAALVERRFASVTAAGPHCALRERPGRLPVVVCAPHSVAWSGSGGSWDALTGPLALAVGRLAGASVLVADGRVGADPAGSPSTPFSLRLAELSAAGKLVVDLHAVDSDAVDVVLSPVGLPAPGGDSDGDGDLVDELADLFDEEDLAVAIDVDVPGGHGRSRLDVVAPALFGGLGTRVRSPLEHPDEWETLVDAMADAVVSLGTARPMA